MGLYNLSEFMTIIKEDMGIKDVPLPVDDKELVKRFDRSALREFSVRYPVISEVWVTSSDAIDYYTRSINGSATYIIPEKYYRGSEILMVLGLNPGGYGSEANMYMPNVVLGSADMLLESIADIKMAAALGSMMCHAPTFRFDPPNKVVIFNEWTSGSYRVECGLKHDLSLATIHPGAFTHLRQLAVLDLEEYLWGKMKRITDLDVGVGSIQLKIDNWESAAQEKKDLLREWDETVNLSVDRVMYY